MQTEAYLELKHNPGIHFDFNQAVSGQALPLHFDNHLDELVEIAHQLILNKGVFHLQIHFSASQLICWTLDNPYNYQIYNAEEVFHRDFQKLFSPLASNLYSAIKKNEVLPILKSLQFLRKRPQGSELRNASLHMMNGQVGLSFACDDTRYLNFRNLLD